MESLAAPLQDLPPPSVAGDAREIFAILLDSYIEELSGHDRQANTTDPFCDERIEAILHRGELVLLTKHFKMEFPADGAGLLAAMAAVDGLAKLSAKSVYGLGTRLDKDEQGYFAVVRGEKQYVSAQPQDEDGDE